MAIAAACCIAMTPIGHARDAAQARALQVFGEGAGAQASLRGDAQSLPSSVARCANCHDSAITPAKPSARDVERGSARNAEVAPRLDAATLLQPVSRRRGPPSRYDEASFCRLLASGIDPAGIMVARTMPVYTIEADACRALWRLLAGPPS